MIDLGRPYAFTRSSLAKQPFQWLLWFVTLFGGIPGFFGLVSRGPDATSACLAAASLLSMYILFRRDHDGVGTMTFDGTQFVVRTGHRVRHLDKRNIVAGYRTDAASFLLREKNGRQSSFTLADDDAPYVDDILEALGVGVGQRAISVPLRPVIGAVVSALLLLFPLGVVALLLTGLFRTTNDTLIGGVAVTVLVALTWISVPVLAAIFGRRLGAPELVVGDDGVRIVGGFRTRLVRYDSLASVVVVPKPPSYPSGIALGGKDRSWRTLAMYGQSSEQISGVVQRIEDAIARAESERSDVAASLVRGARSIAEWRAWLRRAATARGGFRDVVLPLEALEALLVDPGAAIEQRVGAAIALREARVGAPTIVQTRIRVAAEASADPALRQALDLVAASDLDEDALNSVVPMRTARHDRS